MDEHTTELHCYTDGTDTVVAHSADDARTVVAEHLGESAEDVSPMALMDDAKELKILDEDTRETVARTAGEWARASGRGFLCSTEY